MASIPTPPTGFAQRGCARFSHVPAGSVTPPRFRCQPDLATSAADLTPDEQTALRQQVAPVFTSLNLSDPGYGQLSLDCDEQIRRGASDGGEMGTFNTLPLEIYLRRETDPDAAVALSLVLVVVAIVVVAVAHGAAEPARTRLRDAR